MLLAILWLIPIPIGLFAGWLHLTWGNLSFHPEAKRLLVFKAVGLWSVLFAVHSLSDRTAFFRASITTVLLTSYMITLTWKLSPDMVLTGFTGGCVATLASKLSGGVGPATFATVVWIVLTGVLPLADGPFDGVGMIVTSQSMKAIQYILWPIAMTLVLSITIALRRRA